MALGRRWRWNLIHGTLMAANILVLISQLMKSCKEESGVNGPKAASMIPGVTDKPPRPHYPWMREPFIPWNYDWDGHQDEFVKDERYNRKRPFRRLFFIRNGQYYDAGDKTGHLSSTGTKQAHMVGKRLREINNPFTKFVCSSSLRTSETADILKEYVKTPIEHSDLLKEGHPAIPDPKTQARNVSDKTYETDGSRIDKAYKEIFHRADAIAVSSFPSNNIQHELYVTHGNIIGNFVLRSLQLAPERWPQVMVYQASITVIDISAGGLVTLRILGDVGHLPQEMWSG